MKLETRTIGTSKVDIEVDSRSGTFTAVFYNNEYQAPTLTALVDLLRKAERRTRVNADIPVTILGVVPHKPRGTWDHTLFDAGLGHVDATLRAKHERERSVYLYAMGPKGATKFKRGGYGNEVKGEIVARRLTPAEIKQYWNLVEMRDAAQRDYEKYVETIELDRDTALEKRNATIDEGDEA